jgi:hypothetical protein
MNRKGYFFVMDAILGLAVMATAIAYLYSIHVYEQPKSQVYELTQGLMDSLSEKKMVEINNRYKDQLILNGNITNAYSTIIEQASEFEYRNLTKGCGYCMNLSNNLVRNVTEGLIGDQYNFRISLNNTVIYERSRYKESSAILALKSSKLVYVMINENETYGPTYAEVVLWQ